jgi:hypothetical protein
VCEGRVDGYIGFEAWSLKAVAEFEEPGFRYGGKDVGEHDTFAPDKR